MVMMGTGGGHHRPDRDLIHHDHHTPSPSLISKSENDPRSGPQDDAKAQLPPQEERLVEGNLPKMMRELPLLCSI